MNDFNQHLAADARLIILKELVKQPGHVLNETLLQKVLDTFGHKRTREWIRTQMRALADVNAVELTQAGSVLIAHIKQAGRDHVEGRINLDGVDSPSDF